MTAAPTSAAPVEGRRAITLAALLATWMQAVNISLPNAAAPHLQGTLSMTDDQVGWMFTSYIAAGTVVLPLTGWLAARFGRKATLLWSLAVFALGLLLDARADTPLEFVLARIVQGTASGTLAPLSMAILSDVHPPERHARFNLVWTATVLLGIASGPGVGGWLGETYGWPSLFYFSLPVAGFVFLAMALLLPEKKPAGVPPLDLFGLATFLMGVLGLQAMLDRGQRMEWFASPEIWAEAAASAVGFYLFAVHVLTSKAHFFSKGLLRDRNFMVSAVMFFVFGFVLLPTLALTSPMLEELFGYPVDTAGYMTIPRGVALVLGLVLTTLALPRIDSRLFIVGGAALVIWANARMLAYAPGMDWRPVATAGVLQGAGLGMLMPALTRTAFSTLPPALRAEGAVVFNLARLYGSTMGIAVVLIFFHGNTQAVHLALAKHLVPYRAEAHVAGALAPQTLAGLNEMVTGQAAVIAVIGQFKILMIAMLAASPLVLLLRKARPAA